MPCFQENTGSTGEYFRISYNLTEVRVPMAKRNVPVSTFEAHWMRSSRLQEVVLLFVIDVSPIARVFTTSGRRSSMT